MYILIFGKMVYSSLSTKPNHCPVAKKANSIACHSTPHFPKLFPFTSQLLPVPIESVSPAREPVARHPNYLQNPPPVLSHHPKHHSHSLHPPQTNPPAMNSLQFSAKAPSLAVSIPSALQCHLASAHERICTPHQNAYTFPSAPKTST